MLLWAVCCVSCRPSLVKIIWLKATTFPEFLRWPILLSCCYYPWLREAMPASIQAEKFLKTGRKMGGANGQSMESLIPWRFSRIILYDWQVRCDSTVDLMVYKMAILQFRNLCLVATSTTFCYDNVLKLFFKAQEVVKSCCKVVVLEGYYSK